MIRGVLFDIDGTLVDTNDLHATAWSQAFHAFNIQVSPDQVRPQIGKGGDNLIPTLAPGLPQADRTALEAARGELFQRDYLPRATPFPGVRALFERLVAVGLKVVLATSAKEAELNFHLNLMEAADLVSATTSADDVAHSKPCPDIFAAAAEKTGLLPHEALVIGDTPWDMKAAGAAGIAAIGVLSGGFAEAELRAAGARAIYNDPAHLLAAYPEWCEVA